jgi:hypothetical protein
MNFTREKPKRDAMKPATAIPVGELRKTLMPITVMNEKDSARNAYMIQEHRTERRVDRIFG